VSLIVRSANPADLAIVAEFNRRLALESEGKTLDADVVLQGVRTVLAEPVRGRYFLALDGDTVVGQLMITTEWSDWRNGWFWYIQSVYVRAEARRQGVFRALYQHVEATARAEPTVIGLRLYVEKENHVARQTYANLGMSDAGYVVMEKYPL
jgi:ribosomal protein S18 acetylase RimI-like enzyme